MKIYTITCHHVYNHGASLQAYALMKYLERNNHQVEIIDYQPDYLSNHYQLFSIDHPLWRKNIVKKYIYLTVKIPARLMKLKRKKAFDQFTTKYLKLTYQRFTTNQALKKYLANADIYICGSDQIWNSIFKNGRDPAFYLDFAPKDKLKVSYAASFAMNSVPEKRKLFVKEMLMNLDFISVREKTGIQIVNQLGISRVSQVVDPVLLLNKSDWNSIGKQTIIDDYLLIYDFEDNPLIKKQAIMIAREKGWKIFSIHAEKLSYADKNFIYAGPETFISLIRDAKFVLSNSFHAAVFSVLYGKDFAVFNRKEPINTRMRDFLEDLGLGNRLIDHVHQTKKLLEPIEESHYKHMLNNQIAVSKNYLESILHKGAG